MDEEGGRKEKKPQHFLNSISGLDFAELVTWHDTQVLFDVRKKLCVHVSNIKKHSTKVFSSGMNFLILLNDLYV